MAICKTEVIEAVHTIMGPCRRDESGSLWCDEHESRWSFRRGTCNAVRLAVDDGLDMLAQLGVEVVGDSE